MRCGPPNSFVVWETAALGSVLARSNPIKVDFDFRPGNLGLLRMLEVSFSAKKAKIVRFIAKTRNRLNIERQQLAWKH